MIFVSIGTIASATQVWSEEFGTWTGSCSTQWERQYELNLEEFGTTNSLSACSYDDGGIINYVVRQQGATGTFPNGVEKTFSWPAGLGNQLILDVDGLSVEKGVELVYRVVYKTSGGKTLETHVVEDIASMTGTGHLALPAPTGGDSVTLQIGTRGAGEGLGHAFAHRRKFLGAEADLDLVDFYVMRVEC